ncbi:MAG: NUDIX domain-containing protein [Bacteroidaceae bacterium]|nr:NUDIX domain-containing protein [Bacteroidaceae bacterium]
MKENDNEKLPIVDEAGNVTGYASRGEMHDGTKRLHPVVHLHVFNSRGELYLQRRPAWKTIQPGKYDTAVGGHIDYGETVESALLRETREEIGLTDFTPEWLANYVFESDVERELVHVFRTTTDTPPTPSEELDGGRFWTEAEIWEAMGKGVLTPNFEQEYKKIFGHKN